MRQNKNRQNGEYSIALLYLLSEGNTRDRQKDENCRRWTTLYDRMTNDRMVGGSVGIGSCPKMKEEVSH